MNARAHRANAALVGYCRVKGEPLDCHETGIIDLMTDLMHLARREGLDAFNLPRPAQVHFLIELESEALKKYHTTNSTTKGE